MLTGFALGGNLADPERLFRATVQAFSHLLTDLRVAPLYRTRAESPIPQPAYLNTVFVGRTRVDAETLLALGKSLENRAGRRQGPRLAPRVLDIDLLFWGTRSSLAPELTLPHPRMLGRHFVLRPLADLLPDLVLGQDARTVQEALDRLPDEKGIERVEWRARPPT